eukprot:TRINITY_DN112197_c0_g1_i1.p1 TRINITY_DN112197_c0_g1~~TRINITY_DN112197_c0_g1_i1.p1  ORF type:complete len:490 (-),score=102.18 TRINITY_DN112197_c0_g1_i1:55-1464(-)
MALPRRDVLAAVAAVMPVGLSLGSEITAAPMLAWDPRNVPGPAWPGATPVASNQAWPTGLQPGSLKAWPSEEGQPSRCWKVEVLKDSAQGWPAQCDGLQEMPGLDIDQCEESCRQDPMCGVWQFRRSGQCFQGEGLQCDTPAAAGVPVPVVKAQRLQHGDIRVLKDMAGWEVLNLRSVGFLSSSDDPNDGAIHCRALCYSKLFCEYWQFGITGCYIEDPKSTMLGLETKGQAQYPLTTEDGATQTSDFAQSAVGEYIQHICPAHPMQTTTTTSPSDFMSNMRSVGALLEPPSIRKSDKSKYWLMGAAAVLACCVTVLGCLIVCNTKADDDDGGESDDDFYKPSRVVKDVCGDEGDEEAYTARDSFELVQRPLLAESTSGSFYSSSGRQPPTPTNRFPHGATPSAGSHASIGSGTIPHQAVSFPQQQASFPQQQANSFVHQQMRPSGMSNSSSSMIMGPARPGSPVMFAA